MTSDPCRVSPELRMKLTGHKSAEIHRGYTHLELVKLKAASRVWNRDASLWTTVPEHIKVITNRLGWLSSMDNMLKRLPEVTAFCDDVRSSGMTDAVVLGMGGSSLAP